MKYYAHSLDGKPPEENLKSVMELLTRLGENQ
jgi:hypothetical protein